jgi:hypothetical protein
MMAKYFKEMLAGLLIATAILAATYATATFTTKFVYQGF